MKRYMLLDGPLRGHLVDELPDGYEASEESDRIGIWAERQKDYEEMRAINQLMLSAADRLDAATIGKLENGLDVVANNDETRQAVSDFHEAIDRQDRLHRRMAPDLF